MPKKTIPSSKPIQPLPQTLQKSEEEEQQFDFLFFAGLVVILIVIVSILTVSIFLQRTPETFTQVYLNQDKVVDSVKVGQLFQVGFFIENREGKQMDYTYRIIAENEEKIVGKISIPSNESREVIETISFKNPSIEKSKVLIEVSKPQLEEKKESPYTLWFWVKVS